MSGGRQAFDYDRAATNYAANRHAREDLLRRIVAVAGIGPGSAVLEIGCGTGNQVIALAALTGCRAVGVEPSSGMLAAARERDTPVRFVQAPAEALPFAAERFDLAFSVDVIHHVAGRDRYCSEALRVLRPGGSLCTATHTAAMLRQSLITARYFPEAVERDIPRYPPIELLRALLQQAGFAAIEEEVVAMPARVSDATPYAAKAYSSLHLIDEATFQQGLARLRADLARGPIVGERRYLLLWARKPAH